MYRPTKQGYISYYSLSSINIQDSTRVVDPLPVEQRYLHRSFAERPPQISVWLGPEAARICCLDTLEEGFLAFNSIWPDRDGLIRITRR